SVVGADRAVPHLRSARAPDQFSRSDGFVARGRIGRVQRPPKTQSATPERGHSGSGQGETAAIRSSPIASRNERRKAAREKCWRAYWIWRADAAFQAASSRRSLT